MKQIIKTARGLKALPEAGFIEGYASVYDVLDSNGDTVLHGAFDDVIKSGRMPLMFFGHDHRSIPVGKWTEIKDDEHGLRIKGQLNLELQEAKDIYSSLKFGSFDGLSIAGRAAPDGYDIDLNTGLGTISKMATLDEVSIVPMPANADAYIDEVKSEDVSLEVLNRIQKAQDTKDLEAFLRSVGGLSKKQAVAFIAASKRVLKAQSDSESDTALHVILDRMAKITH